MLDERRLFTVAQTPRQPSHGALDGVALARGDGRVGRRLHGELSGIVVRVVATERVLELAHALAHRPADLRKTLGAEQEQREQQQEHDLPGADVGHEPRVAVWTPAGGKDDGECPAKSPSPSRSSSSAAAPTALGARSRSARSGVARGSSSALARARRSRARPSTSPSRQTSPTGGRSSGSSQRLSTDSAESTRTSRTRW